MRGQHRWTRTVMIGESVVSTETISFSATRRGLVRMPLERVEELLFEAGYSPVEGPGLDSGTCRETSPL